jgi:hypothetical protein
MLWKIALSILLFVAPVMARDDGRYAGAPLHEWFDGLASGYGRCCSDADGTAVVDADWESHDGHYRVRIDSNWYDVPDKAVIRDPNRDGRTIVWPSRIWMDGKLAIFIRCFMPGSMT